ncbi:hypothetical protein LJC32_02985 [Oscillospiraceae bacterium OttesenSCG-928-F05]|nr:hypothetical protein [Oscillospiraceae bacterium OttesenSCG-928-F05]
MKRICCLILCAAVLFTAALPIAHAADLYPAAIEQDGDSESPVIRKVYLLEPGDTPADIPTADFVRGGVRYTFVDMTKEREELSDVREHTEEVSLPASSGDLSAALALFEPTLDYTDEEGYTGTLALDHTTVQVSADGYSTRNFTVSAVRTYPNLSAADVSLVPKTTEEKGRTLQLADVSWSEAHTGNVDGYDVAERYTATATYTGSATSRTATGFTATASYTGEVMRILPGPVRYTAIFEGAELTPPTPQPTPEPTPEPEAAQKEPGIVAPVVSSVLTLAAIFAAWYAVPRAIRKWRARREK